MLVALMHGARENITIVTPYFIPDDPLLSAMKIAVLRGVRVELIASAQEDQVLVGHAQKSYYEELLEAGIGIHLFAESFLHAKFVTIDGRAAFVGSSNLDVRSFVLNAEITLLVYDAGIAGQLAAEQRRYIETSRVLTAAEWSKRSALTRLGQNIARLVSPLL